MPEREFRTADSKDYYFNEVPANSICTLRFRVKTAHDAHICLVSNAAQDAEPILEIFLGGWDNKMSGIRRDRASTDKVKVSTADILTAKEYHAFWIKWDNAGMVDVGRAGTAEPFMSYKDPSPFPINHYGLRTCWGATGKWKDHELEYALQEGVAPRAPAVPEREDLEPPVDHVVTPTPSPPSTPGQQPYHWVKAANGNIPDGAVEGGMDHGEQVLYIGRVWYQSVQLIGKVNTLLQGARVCCGGRELLFAEYEVLCGGPQQPQWLQNPGNGLPCNSVAGGKGSNGETYYVGKMSQNGTVTPGMIIPSQGHCHIAYNGQEWTSNNFEVLLQ